MPHHGFLDEIHPRTRAFPEYNGCFWNEEYDYLLTQGPSAFQQILFAHFDVNMRSRMLSSAVEAEDRPQVRTFLRHDLTFYTNNIWGLMNKHSFDIATAILDANEALPGVTDVFFASGTVLDDEPGAFNRFIESIESTDFKYGDHFSRVQDHYETFEGAQKEQALAYYKKFFAYLYAQINAFTVNQTRPMHGLTEFLEPVPSFIKEDDQFKGNADLQQIRERQRVSIAA